MRAWVSSWDRAGNTIQLRSVPDPEPSSSELLLDVKAAALNRADLIRLERMGPGDEPRIPGVEVAGEVLDVGAGVMDWKVGDRVMAMCTSGYAERVVVDHRIALRVPERLTWCEAAAIPVGYMTEHDALVSAGRFAPGDAVLITAASSGVGLAGVQLARKLGARPLVATVSRESSAQRMERFGVDTVIASSSDESVLDVVMSATDGRGVDVVLDHLGGAALAANLQALAVGGRLVTVGRLLADCGELDLDLLAYKRASIVGVTFRTRTVDQQAAIVHAMSRDVGPLLKDGSLQPVIDRTFGFADAVAAQAHLASDRHFGKVILEVAA